MSEFNLTPGQAVDLMFDGKIIEDIHGTMFYRMDGEFRCVSKHGYLFIPDKDSKYREFKEPMSVKGEEPMLACLEHGVVNFRHANVGGVTAYACKMCLRKLLVATQIRLD